MPKKRSSYELVAVLPNGYEVILATARYLNAITPKHATCKSCRLYHKIPYMIRIRYVQDFPTGMHSEDWLTEHDLRFPSQV